MTLLKDATLQYKQPYADPCESYEATSWCANEMSHLKYINNELEKDSLVK